MQPDTSRISSLTDFPVPRDQTGVRSFLGLCNQLAFFIPDYQQRAVALRQLTGKGRSFLWLPEHQVEFDKLKTILTSDMIVRHSDSSKKAVLLTDASRLFVHGYALGHLETDHAGKEIFKIVRCGSKGLTPLGAAAYQLGNTSSCTITEVKQRWARLVLGWVTVQVLPECCC